MDRNLARSAGCEWQSWEGNLKRQRDLFLCDANAERFWHWGTLLSKDESVFLFDRHAWLTLKFIFEGGDEIRRDKELAHACVCVCTRECVETVWEAALWQSDPVRTEIWRVCALEAGILVPAVSVPCEYGTCALGFVPRLSEFCLQVSNLLQLHQTKSVPTNG